MTADDWKAMTETFKDVVKQPQRLSISPRIPKDQLDLATEAVFRSWNGKRAMDYRNAAGIAHDLGTAVNIVTMVFGNMGSNSGTGVAFTRDPATGENKMYGDYLINAQGEDVVAGIRNTEKIENLANDMPAAYKEFHADHRKAGTPLPRYAGCRIHHRRRQALDAADPQRKTNRKSGC